MVKTTTKILFVLLITVLNLTAQTEQVDSLNVQSNDTTFVMQKSAWGAVLRSAVIPGWGQFYTKSYWKIPVIWGFIGYFSYVWIDNNKQYKNYRDLYAESGYKNTNYVQLRDFYRDQRDEFAIYIGLTYFLQLIDAYVDAHLFDFNVTPDPVTLSPQISISYHF